MLYFPIPNDSVLIVALSTYMFILPQSGWTPLHISAYKGHLGTVRMLLEDGASVNVEDEASNRCT